MKQRMGQQSQNNQWPKAAVAILGTASISAASYYGHEPLIMYSMILLLFIILCFN